MFTKERHPPNRPILNEISKLYQCDFKQSERIVFSEMISFDLFASEQGSVP